MKEYIKPIVEIIDFQSKDDIMSDLASQNDGDMSGNLPGIGDAGFEDWG